MKSSAEELRRLCPDVDERLVEEHVSRLDADYFESFDLPAVAGHLRGLAQLSADHPVEVVITVSGDQADCTVLAFDYPSEFSLITGVLASMGFSIVSGDIFTYAAPAATGSRPRRRRTPTDDAHQLLLRRRRIVDHFRGAKESGAPVGAWVDEVRRRLGEVIGLLEGGAAESAARAKHMVNEMVASRLSELQADILPLLYPVEIHIDNERGPCTTLRVVSQDTPAFLYALSSALSLRGTLIEHVRIRTTQGRIEDEIDVVDSGGRKILDRELLDQIRLSVLLTKQFTYFVSRAPDPYTALCRFEQMVQDVLRLPERGQWMDMLSNPRALQDLAKLLGASDFIWEDWIRLQYETLLPILKPHLAERRFARPAGELAGELDELLAGAESLEEQQSRLNEFKDGEIFRIDLDHILRSTGDPRALAEPLTQLAELVVNTAARLVQADLVKRHGTPRTVGGLEARCAMFGLGKLGGAALGYASDIELLFVYSDNGRTDGPAEISNSEFYERLVRETARFIVSKREGIFHVDVRLRPHGESGPWACSLESFCRYYGPGGPALSYERLALVRLRPIGGSLELGSQVERLRDEFVYSTQSIDLKELRELREKQFSEKVRDLRYNAKFSPGALVDLEYDVQILQVMHGKDAPSLRTPRIHEALASLSQAGVLTESEARQLVEAYYFFRRLVNGLRMLRGSARDLFLPSTESQEFAHLARRMGYERGGELAPELLLHMEFETQTAVVRAFIERHFGRGALPGPVRQNVVDLVLGVELSREAAARILHGAGLLNANRAQTNLRNLAGEGSRRELFARLAVLACDMLARMPDPDMALNNWERFAAALKDVDAHYSLLLSQPRRLEVLLGIFSMSQFLADALVRNPEFFDWVADPESLHRVRTRESIERDWSAFSGLAHGHGAWLNALRTFRRREILRIGTRDMCLHVPIQEAMEELSRVADAITGIALDRAWLRLEAEGRIRGVHEPASRFCIMALGKLGGNELNYSSDIDLLGLCDDAPEESGGRREDGVASMFELAMERVQKDLSGHTEEGYAYRVDLRLRPYGSAGPLVHTVSSLVDYYAHKAELWEVQALLKVRPVAGNLALGQSFLSRVRPVLMRRRSREEVVGSIERMRTKAVQTHRTRLLTGTDLKSGFGGLRDVEFLTQALQLLHAPEHPELIQGSTVAAVRALSGAGILAAETCEQLIADYFWLRRIEHYLQILEDRQIHSLPHDPQQLTALSKRLLGVRSEPEEFKTALNECQKRIRGIYEMVILGGQTAGRGGRATG